MTPRVVAAFSLLVGVAGFLGYLTWVGEGPFASPESRHLREMKDRMEVPSHVVPYTIADFAALPHARPMPEYAPLERRGVSLEGYVQIMIASVDGDFHLNLTPNLPAGVASDSLTVTAEITPQWHRRSTRWRWERLGVAFRPHTWTDPPWPAGPRRVRISGWLFYDSQYDAPYGAARKALMANTWGQRLTGWEIHPVTRIELWDDSLAAFVELPR